MAIAPHPAGGRRNRRRPMHVFDYETLRIIWWVLLGLLLIGFAVMDGFDLGAGMLLPFVARTDGERRIVLNAVGPVWEGNQVWLILGAGAIFAAWPTIYAVAFSGFYLAMFLALCSLILRPVGFKFRSKMPGPRWRAAWDWLLFVSGLVPALIFGVAVGNALSGVPFRFDSDLRLIYEGGLIGLLHPYALLCGLVSVAMLVMHGGAYLAVKAPEPVAGRASRAIMLGAVALILLFTLAGILTAESQGYRITSALVHDGPSNPIGKAAEHAPGAWLSNYAAMPWTLLAPVLGFAGALLAATLTRYRRDGLAWVASAAAVVGVVATAGVSMFPFILPSSIDPASSLTVWDSSSSPATLLIMLVAAAIFMPIIIAYTGFVYSVLRGRVTQQQVDADHSSY
jgi:cytochrome d ubiquinol oxidase subunit II